MNGFRETLRKPSTFQAKKFTKFERFYENYQYFQENIKASGDNMKPYGGKHTGHFKDQFNINYTDQGS